MTLRELRELLANISTKHDQREVLIWMPGVRVEIVKTPPSIHGEGPILLEGNAMESVILGGPGSYEMHSLRLCEQAVEQGHRMSPALRAALDQLMRSADAKVVEAAKELRLKCEKETGQ